MRKNEESFALLLIDINKNDYYLSVKSIENSVLKISRNYMNQ
jgi:hypothetical protein